MTRFSSPLLTHLVLALRVCALLVCALLVCVVATLPSPHLVAVADDAPEADAPAADAPGIVLADVTDACGLESAKGDRFSFGDYDDDGDADLLINGNALYRNDSADGSIRFTNVSKASGIQHGPGGGACFVDLDLDGDLDVVTTNGGLKIQDDDGRFTHLAKERGLVLDKRMASLGVGDVDGDGYPDLLFGGGENWNDGNAEYFPRRLFRNIEGVRWEDVSEEHALTEGRYGRAVVFADYDRDGDLDAYLGNYRLMANELLRNDAGRLDDVAEAAGVQGKLSSDRGTAGGQSWGYRYGHTIAASWCDLDADGDLDLWVSNLVHKFVGESGGSFDIRGWICDDSALYRNDGPPHWGFTDLRAECDIPLMPTGDRSVFRGDELWSHAAHADLDLDGLPEVFVTQVYQLPYAHSLLFHNRGGFCFEEISGAVGVRRFDSYGAAFADLDGDGDVDLVTNGRGTPKGDRGVRCYRNDTAPGPWIGWRLYGKRGEPDPVGAQVTCVLQEGRLVRQIDGAMGSHAQQGESVLRFGLRGRTLDSVWVRWPGGIVQKLPEAEPGAVHALHHPKEKIPELRLTVIPNEEDGTVSVRAKARGSRLWKIAFDLDHDGVFEAAPKDGRVVLDGEEVAEVRVRVFHRGKGLGREAVIRIPVDPTR